MARENDLLADLRTLFSSADPSVRVGSGPDDCAHVLADGRRLAFSIDAFAEGSHFTADAPPEAVARKALGASLSDLAGSACQARWVLVTLCLRHGAADGWAGAFARGLADAARDWNVAVVGGDTVSSPTATVVTVAAAGEPLPGGPLLRDGARPGDILAVSGTLGGSILGRHLTPEPRLREMDALMHCFSALGKKYFPTAAMDISDGLALDLSRLCVESSVGATLDADSIPVSEAAVRLAARSGRTALDHALEDGEDFEILLSMPEAAWQKYQEHAACFPAGLARFTAVGRVDREAGVRLAQPDGRIEALAARGYEHQW